jgi:hypothetical protein
MDFGWSDVAQLHCGSETATDGAAGLLTETAMRRLSRCWKAADSWLVVGDEPSGKETS